MSEFPWMRMLGTYLPTYLCTLWKRAFVTVQVGMYKKVLEFSDSCLVLQLLPLYYYCKEVLGGPSLGFKVE